MANSSLLGASAMRRRASEAALLLILAVVSCRRPEGEPVIIVAMPVRDVEVAKQFVSQLPVGCPPASKQPCASDVDCTGGCLCACSSRDCTIIPEGTSIAGDLDGRCYSRRARIEGRLRLRAKDGGIWLDTGSSDIAQ